MKPKTLEHKQVGVSAPDKDNMPEAEEHRNYHQLGVLPVLQSKEQTRAFYDRIASVYDLLAERSEGPVCKAGLDMLQTQPGQQILEIGFGTGHCLIELAQAVTSSGRVFGIDLSEKMREIAQNRAQDKGLENVVELTCGDAMNLPYASASLDAIFMSFTLELFDTPEILRVLAECKRVLKPGGRIIVIGMSRVKPDGLMTEVFEWTHQHFPNFLDCRPILVRQALEDAGFAIAAYRLAKMWIHVEIVCGFRASDSKQETEHV